jgi:hypothetical protein
MRSQSDSRLSSRVANGRQRTAAAQQAPRRGWLREPRMAVSACKLGHLAGVAQLVEGLSCKRKDERMAGSAGYRDRGDRGPAQAGGPTAAYSSRSASASAVFSAFRTPVDDPAKHLSRLRRTLRWRSSREGIIVCARSKSLHKSPFLQSQPPPPPVRPAPSCGPDLLKRAVERDAALARGCQPRSATYPGRARTPIVPPRG